MALLFLRLDITRVQHPVTENLFIQHHIITVKGEAKLGTEKK